MRTLQISIFLLMLVGCVSSTPEASGFVGTWQYDRQSLRDDALRSAIDSVSGGDPATLSDAERAEVEAWVNENHATWDKTIVIEPGGRFRLTSRVGGGRAEIIEGAWLRKASVLRLIETDGRLVALATLSEDRLELAPSEVIPGSGVMVMVRLSD